MLRQTIGILLAGVVSASPAHAEDACNRILEHGIYNFFRTSNENASAAQTRSQICTAYSRLQSDITSGGVQASYKVFEGSASFSRQQLDSIGSSMCASAASAASSSASSFVGSTVISPEAVQAWQQCQAQANQNLQFTTTFHETPDGVDSVIIGLSYKNLFGALRPKILDVVISPIDSFSCAGPLWDSRKRSTISSFMSMTCRRKISATPVRVGGRYLYATSSQINVSTEAGPLDLSFDYIEAASPDTNVPVGSVVSLATAKVPVGWLPCDGRSVSRARYSALFARIGTAYGAGDGLTTFNLPDLRGRLSLGASARPEQALGAQGGQETHQLTLSELPAHHHTGNTGPGLAKYYRIVRPNNGAVGDPVAFENHETGWYGGGFVDKTDDKYSNANHIHSFTTSDEGGGVVISLMPPYVALLSVIRVE